MDQPNTIPSPASGCLSRIGLATLVACGTLFFVTLTVLLPPWVNLRSQRRQVLYWSEQVKVYDQTFAGFDYLFAGRKWQTIGPPTVPASEQYFDFTEFQIFWPVL